MRKKISRDTIGWTLYVLVVATYLVGSAVAINALSRRVKAPAAARTER